MESPAPAYDAPNTELLKPLTNPDSIRILTVFESDNAEDDIECHLAEKRLCDLKKEKEGYMAISYARGDLNFTHEIWLGDQRLLISANLDSALRHLRRQDVPILLWVDAVCINQEDLVEKSSQVQQMHKIFSAASETIIWLGPGGGNTNVAAWNFLERHSSWALNDLRERDYTIPTKLQEDLLSFRGELRDVEIDVLSRPWFSRLWVFQEAVASRHLRVQCGHRRIAWKDFSKAVLQAERHDDRYGFSMRDDCKRDIVRDISRARREYVHRHRLDDSLPSNQTPESGCTRPSMLNILSLLHQGRYLEVSDSRDKIFGFLGIAEGINTDDPRFRVDYKLDTGSLYTQFARNMIEATNSLEILSYVDFSTPNRHRANIEVPSWVPCWDYHNRFVNQGFYHRSDRTILDTLPKESSEEEDARKARVAASNIVWSQDESEPASLGSMQVSGRVVGRIGTITGPIWLNRNDQILFQHLMSVADEEEKRFPLMMALWARRLTSTSYGPNLKAEIDFIDRARTDGDPWEDLARTDKDPAELPEVFSGSRDLRGLRPHLKQATINGPNLTVQGHLYRRGHVTAGWSGQNLDRDVPMTFMRVIDDKSIVDGRCLAICVSDTPADSDAPEQTAEQLALVPGAAKEGDLIIQISGARVPFVVRKRPNDQFDLPPATSTASVSQESLVMVLKSWAFPWGFIGDCLVNNFEELAEDAMDTRFKLV